MDALTNQWTKMLDSYYAKSPALPVNIKELLVSFAPWAALIGGIFSVLFGVAGFGVLTALSPFATAAGAGSYALFGIISSILLLAQGVLLLLAFSPLKVKRARGWNLWFWVLVLGVLSSVVSLRIFGIVEAIIGALIGYYFLYQVKSYYK